MTVTVAQLAEERRDRRWLIWLVVAFALLVVITLFWGIPHIENGLTAATDAELRLQGWESMSASFSGRDATLTGTLPPEVDVDEVERTVAAIDGVRRVRYAGAPEASAREVPATTAVPTAGPTVSIAVSDSALELSGTLPSQSAVDGAMSAAAQAFPPDQISGTLTVGEVTDPPWLGSIWGVLPTLPGAGDVSIEASRAGATVFGSAVSEEARDAVVAALIAAVGENLTVTSELDVVELSAPEVRMTAGEAGVALSGVLPNQQLVDDAAAAATAAFAPEAVSNELTVGPVAAAEWLTGLWASFPALAVVDHLDLEVKDAGITIGGSVAQEAMVVEVESAVRDLVGSSVSVTSLLTVDLDAAAEACPEDELNDLVDAGVLFGSNSAELSEDGADQLDAIATLLEACPGVPVEIAGHTDSNGSDAYNLDLSQQRAEAVREYLIEQGVAATRLAAVGYGETQPIATNDTAEGRAENRRIEFNVGETT